jgi:hypothetical protein
MDLAKLKSAYIKAGVAGNKNTPKAILDQFMKLKGEDYTCVFEGLARNPKMKLKDLAKILKAFQEYRYVKWNILCNPNILAFNHEDNVKLFREIVSGCIEDEEEAFHYEMQVQDAFRASKELLEDIIANVEMYVITTGYTEAYKKLFTELLGGVRPAEKVEVTSEPEATLTPTAKIEELDDQDFDSLIEQGEIVEFERTDGKGVEDVLRIKTEIEDFKSFNQWLKSNKKGYYSRFAKGFILYPEFAKELKLKLGKGTQAAASVAASIYSADMLQAFASGTLF